MKYLVLILFLPFFLIADMNEVYSTLFSQYLMEENLEKCESILDEWENYHNPGHGQIMALRASLMLSKGEIEEGKNLLQESLSSIPEDYLSDLMKSMIKKIVENPPLFSLAAKGVSHLHIMLCERKQPKGLAFRYWFGVAQVAVGCVVVPFNAAAGGSLIATGLSTVVHAGADCLDNMEKWEKEAQNRQKIDVDKMSFFENRASFQGFHNSITI